MMTGDSTPDEVRGRESTGTEKRAKTQKATNAKEKKSAAAEHKVGKPPASSSADRSVVAGADGRVSTMRGQAEGNVPVVGASGHLPVGWRPSPSCSSICLPTPGWRLSWFSTSIRSTRAAWRRSSPARRRCPWSRSPMPSGCRADHVYVTPPNKDSGRLARCASICCLAGAPRPSTPIDSFFRSLAEDQGSKSIGVILSGTGSDGMLGLRAIKAASGMALVQDPASAKYGGHAIGRSRGGLRRFLAAAGRPSARSWPASVDIPTSHASESPGPRVPVRRLPRPAEDLHPLAEHLQGRLHLLQGEHRRAADLTADGLAQVRVDRPICADTFRTPPARCRRCSTTC